MDWVNDPKNRPFVLIGFIVIVGAAVFLVGKQAGMFSGGGGGAGIIQPQSSSPEDEAMAAAERAAEEELFGSASPGRPSPGAVTPGPGELAPPPEPGTTAVTGEAAGAEVAFERRYPQQPTRGDPFTPLPSARIRRVELPKIFMRTVSERPADQEEAYETIPMRMAGLLWNGSLMAILEENGNSHVVRPGDVIGPQTGGDNIKVLSIKQSSMTVQIGRRVEEVFMRPAPPPGEAGPPSTGRPGTPGRPGRPGGMPPIEPPDGGGGGAFGAQ